MDIIDNVRKNIKHIMNVKHITQNELAEMANFSSVYVSDLLRGNKGVGLKINTLDSIAKALGVSITNLLINPSEIRHFETIYEDTSSVASKVSDYDYIKFYDVKVSAGSGIPAENESTRLLPVERSFITRLGYPSDMLSAVEVMGDSMEPTLRNGDYVIIHRPEYTADFVPGIYVIRDFSGLKVKRLDMDKFGNLNVISDNKCYNPQEYTQDEISSEVVKIIGRVLGKIGMM